MMEAREHEVAESVATKVDREYREMGVAIDAELADLFHSVPPAARETALSVLRAMREVCSKTRHDSDTARERYEAVSETFLTLRMTL